MIEHIIMRENDSSSRAASKEDGTFVISKEIDDEINTVGNDADSIYTAVSEISIQIQKLAKISGARRELTDQTIQFVLNRDRSNLSFLSALGLILSKHKKFIKIHNILRYDANDRKKAILLGILPPYKDAHVKISLALSDEGISLALKDKKGVLRFGTIEEIAEMSDFNKKILKRIAQFLENISEIDALKNVLSTHQVSIESGIEKLRDDNVGGSLGPFRSVAQRLFASSKHCPVIIPVRPIFQPN